MIAVKGNRVYRITEEEKERRRTDGYDIYGDDGKILAYAKGKTIPYEEHLAQVEKLKAENKKLAAELKKLKEGGKSQEGQTSGKE